MVDFFEKPELHLARVSLPEFRFGSTRSFSLRSRGLLKNIYDPYNVIRLIMSFLSRSTQESGFQTKK